jgi:hypothetical protein
MLHSRYTMTPDNYQFHMEESSHVVAGVFQERPDPRRAQGRRYELPYILLYAVLAVLAGAIGYRRIQRFMDIHRERLNAVFGTRWKRAPAHTAVRDILQGLNEQDLEPALRRHSRVLLSEESEPKGLRLAIDGKGLKGSFDHFLDRQAAQMLSALATQEQLVLGQLAVSDKSNEIPAGEPLIEELGLTDCLFTLDALHCQKKPLR